MKSINKNYAKTKKLHSKRLPAFVAIGLIGLAVIILLEVTNTTHVFHKAKLSVSTIQATHPAKTTATATASKQVQSKTSSPSSNNQSDKNVAPTVSPDSNTTVAPAQPAGTWVGDHQPSLGSQPDRTQENSVCVTTPGASCYIEFTQGSIVKKLDAETADSNGAVYWTWSVPKAGFTAGTWQIEIVATLNGKTTTSTDPRALEVQP